MNKFYALLACCIFVVAANGQTRAVHNNNSTPLPKIQPYGKVDIADLQMASCDFEKDANAEILFDKGVMLSGGGLDFERHTRIKIFNDAGKFEANINLIYSSTGVTYISDLQGETFNLENGKVEITPLDKRLVYTKKIDKIFSALTFAMPNVKPGSVIEIKYREIRPKVWYFQSSIPTRYSEIKTDFSTQEDFRYIPHLTQAFVKNVGDPTDYIQDKALANIHSLPNELYMSSRQENLQRMEYLSRSKIINSWEKIGDLLLKFTDFGDQLDNNVPGTNGIVNEAKALKTDDERIAFIFDTVKNSMKWNEITHFYTTDGTHRAWNRKSGNSAEINLIVYKLLKNAGIKCYPLIVSTKANGKINPVNPNIFQFNNTVVYVPVDSTKVYVLDATNKFNLYNTIPTDQLNTFGLSIDEDNKNFKTVFIENTAPVIQAVFLKAEINPSGKMEGTSEITSYSYNKISAVKKYKTDGREKYIDYLRNNDNSLKISMFKIDNMEVDSLPLNQKIEFSSDLSASDGSYIYFGTNLFTGMEKNPFVNEDRYSDIDFGFKNNYSINGIYKLPSGYKTEVLPKSLTMVSPDQSIVFRRTIIEENGVVAVRYVLNHKKTIYFKEDYQDLRGFYQKMYELLNEQIVLKKS
jgi:hypothetical protein